MNKRFRKGDLVYAVKGEHEGKQGPVLDVARTLMAIDWEGHYVIVYIKDCIHAENEE